MVNNAWRDEEGILEEEAVIKEEGIAICFYQDSKEQLGIKEIFTLQMTTLGASEFPNAYILEKGISPSTRTYSTEAKAKMALATLLKNKDKLICGKDVEEQTKADLFNPEFATTNQITCKIQKTAAALF